MFSHKSSDVFLMHVVALVLLPLEGWNEEHLVSPASTCDIFLNLLVVMAQPWYFSSLPRQMTYKDLKLNRDKEKEAIDDDGPLVDITPHGWIRCFYHFFFNPNKKL